MYIQIVKSNWFTNILKIGVMILLIAVVLLPASVHAGSKGQQIKLNACGASQVIISGNNQNGDRATVTVNDPPCGWDQILWLVVERRCYHNTLLQYYGSDYQL